MTDQHSPAPIEALRAQLSPDHLQRILDSGIAPDVAFERGYRTAYVEADIPEGFNRAQRKLFPSLIIPVWGVDPAEDPVTHEMRPDNPRTDGRTARGGQAPKELKYEFPAGQAKVLDVPRRCRALLGDPKEPLWITEGARKADAAASIGLCAVSLAGVWAFRSTNVDGGRTELADFDRIAFNNRVVYIAFDSDVVTKTPVKQAMVRLAALLTRRGASVHVMILPSGPAGEKRGLDDLIAGGARTAELVRLVNPDFLDEEDNRGQAEKLRDFVMEAYDLGQDMGGNGFAVPRSGSRLVRMLYTGRPSLELEAPRQFSESDPAKPVIPRKVVKDVMPSIEMSCMECDRQPLYLRTAPMDLGDQPGIVIDMGDPAGRVIGVSSRGWKVIDRPDERFPLFRRTENVAELPEPERGGNLDELRALLNVTDNTWPLIKGWLIAVAFGWVPRPWLYNTGPQGSAKSDAALLALSVLDPRETLDAAPRKNDRGDPAALANNSYLIGFDNLTTIPAEFSDWLCSVVTGARDSRRILNTTSSMQSMSFMRSGAMTGIAIRSIRPDLLERLVTVEFERLPTGGKKRHEAIMRSFHAAHARILGGLLDCIVGVLQHLDDVPENLDVPRMVDYASILAAHDMATGEHTFEAYRDVVLGSLDESGTDDAIGQVVLDYVRDEGEVRMAPEAMYQALTKHRASMADVGEEDYWPKNARGLTVALKELVASLERLVTIRVGKANGVRFVSLAPVPKGRDARDADESLATLPASLTKDQVNPMFSTDRDARDDDFQSLTGETKANDTVTHATNVQFGLGFSKRGEACDPCVPVTPETCLLPGETAGTQDRVAATLPAEANDTTASTLMSFGSEPSPAAASAATTEANGQTHVLDHAQQPPIPTKVSERLPRDLVGLFAGHAPETPARSCSTCRTVEVPDSEMAYFQLCPSCTAGSLRKEA
jgi:hypothetical protein